MSGRALPNSRQARAISAALRAASIAAQTPSHWADRASDYRQRVEYIPYVGPVMGGSAATVERPVIMLVV